MIFLQKKFCRMEKSLYFCTRFRGKNVLLLESRESLEIVHYDAEIAQLVEHDLAKVGVASSSLVFRSSLQPTPESRYWNALVVEW